MALYFRVAQLLLINFLSCQGDLFIHSTAEKKYIKICNKIYILFFKNLKLSVFLAAHCVVHLADSPLHHNLSVGLGKYNLFAEEFEQDFKEVLIVKNILLYFFVQK